MSTSKSLNPSSSSNPRNKFRYDIFLSFRGSDTREKFTDHLHHALIREGFQIFRDREEIELCEAIKIQLREAILDSRMSVIVLSENYANSKSCLFELQTALERYEKSDHFILPVFYEVKPEVLKKQAKKLVFREKEVTPEEVKGWSVALTEVARMAGLASHGYEAEFVEKVVRELKRKLPLKQLYVGDHLVDMDSRTEYIHSWLNDRSSELGILLICGMGGIGKTTIAKFVYNSNHHNYDAACFLENINGVSKGHNGLVRLQKHLLWDILRKNERINNVDDGRRRMEYALSNKKVLLVLDDVDQREQLIALAGEQDWFSPGSKIIVTTRLTSTITMLKSVMRINDDAICDVYKLEKLSDDDSLELFSWHAFRQESPIQGHVTLSKRFVQHCDGLPLALQVLGSSCREKSKDVWENDLRKLQAYPDNTIQGKLEISYDSLDEHDKNLFLDIACFFVGKKKKEAIAILDGCDYYALAGIHNLEDRNLLTIEDKKLQIHQLLQDMGKGIVRCESDYPEERSRIWLSEESCDILLKKKGTSKIKGLVLDVNLLGNSNEVVFEADTFEKTDKLRLLKLSGVQLSGSYKASPKGLRWLYWYGFPSESFPSDFPLDKLVVLDMQYSNLKRVWEGTKVLESLKILNLSHSPNLSKTPNFSRIPNLEKVILKACPNLFELDESIIELRRIESLNLQDCHNLRKLPRSIGVVESLLEIDISGCSNLAVSMEELVNMKSLQVLKASGIYRAVTKPSVPEPMAQRLLPSLPYSLVRLDLSYCKLTDDSFPRDLSKLSNLRELVLAGNLVSSLPNFIKDLTGLQTLDLSYCPKLRQIRWSSTTTLYHLDVLHCYALEEITFEARTDVKCITCACCLNLNHIQGKFKSLPVREVDVQMLNSIGFFDLDYMADVEATIQTSFTWRELRKLPVQIVHEDNAFYTHFPGRRVPCWFSNKNSGSTISFTATVYPHFRFRGLNLCAVYTLPEERRCSFDGLIYVTIDNKSSGMMTGLREFRFCGIPEKDGEMVWLIHCFRENMFTEGDQVEVSFWFTDGGQIKECGAHLLYFEDDREVSQYVSTIQRSWDPTLSPYELETDSTANKDLRLITVHLHHINLRLALDFLGLKGKTRLGQAALTLSDRGGLNLHPEPLNERPPLAPENYKGPFDRQLSKAMRRSMQHARPRSPQGTSHHRKRSLPRVTVARRRGEFPHPDVATTVKSSAAVQSRDNNPLAETAEDMTYPRLNLSNMFASLGQTPPNRPVRLPAVQVPTHQATSLALLIPSRQSTSPLPQSPPPPAAREAARASKRTHSKAFPEDTAAAAKSSPSEGPITPWAPTFERGDRLVLQSDSACSPDTALALAKAIRLPEDEHRQKEVSLDMLRNTSLSHCIRAAQEAMELADRVQAKESEVLRLTEQNTEFLRSIDSLTTERDRYKDTVAKLGEDLDASQQELAEERIHRAEAEKNFNTAANHLADQEKEVEELKGKLQQAQGNGYNQAVEDFKAQLPEVGQKIWAACWAACLTKARVTARLPIWSDDRVSPEEIAQIFRADAPSIPFDETPE